MELPISLIKSCDIVLTTYTEVMNSYPRPPKGPHTGPAYEQWMKDAKESAGDLHIIEWFRIVLDEAHTIKNNGSQTSAACQSLSGKRRWAMSGTPIQNRLDDLFPYFRFLRVWWTNDYLDIKKHFCDPDADDANTRVAIVLSIIMMRRTMRDKILGLPIVPLPQIHTETKYISFSKEESVLYRLLEDRFRQNLNRHFSQGTAAKNYGTFMVQLLRLRQCTAHPFLLEQTIKDTFNLQDTKS